MSWDDRYDRFERRPVRTGVKWAWIIIGLFVLAGIVFSIIGFANSWWKKGLEVAGPQNVSEQYRYVIRDWEGAVTAAQNACSAGDKAKNDDSPTFVEDPAQAYAATYRKIVADYNRRMENIFEAKLVGPPGYPDRIPATLYTDNKNDWCVVADKLAEMSDAE